jgi:hypothetical protein
MIKKIFATILVILMLVPGSQVFAAGLYDGYALADGVVTGVRPFVSSSPPCYVAYEVILDGNTYIGEDTSYDFCHLEVGDTVQIKYLVADVRKNEVATEVQIGQINQAEGGDGAWKWSVFGLSFDAFVVLPLGIFLVFVVVMVFVSIRYRKKMDLDGDGMAGDDRPATAEQKKLIVEGFRRLGVPHEVKRKLTQAQAREVLREIDRKLKRRR